MPRLDPRAKRARRAGTLLLLTAVMMVALVAMMALALDLGYIQTVRTDLQAAADSAALAGASALCNNSNDGCPTALSYARQNVPGLQDEDVEVTPGKWDLTTRQFQPGSTPYDALRVVVNQNDRPLFFGAALGTRSFDMSAEAVAIFRPRDIMLVLDFSGSMNDENKINELKDAVNVFADLIETTGSEDRVGFVRYSTDATLKMSLTGDVTAVANSVMSEAADGYTDISDGMMLGRQELESNGRNHVLKMMIVMTDGLANRPTNNPRGEVLDEADAAAADSFPVVSISFGADADTDLMQRVADITSGVHFNVTGVVSTREDELKSVFLKVASRRPVQLVD